jgi:hypothetical protein
MDMLLWLLYKKGVSGGLFQISDQALLFSNLPHLGHNTSDLLTFGPAIGHLNSSTSFM